MRAGKLQRSQKLVGDGLRVATPIGSTGYSGSAGGPRLPLDSELLALTGLAVHRPSEWSNTVLNDQATIEVEVIDYAYRPVQVQTHLQQLSEISQITISSSLDCALVLLLESR